MRSVIFGAIVSMADPPMWWPEHCCRKHGHVKRLVWLMMFKALRSITTLTRTIIRRDIIYGRVRGSIVVGERICHVGWWSSFRCGKSVAAELHLPARRTFGERPIAPLSLTNIKVSQSNAQSMGVRLISILGLDFDLPSRLRHLIVQNIHSSLPIALLNGPAHVPHHALVTFATV